ncbi:hypothetical protein [Rothia nasimurium]|uniref:hypothetical protein n=1 Tax=Rothia nasimurium TaxID=85336 RepID=UPI0016259E98|nr:hypothetical protein [Rothia nasimurium]
MTKTGLRIGAGVLLKKLFVPLTFILVILLGGFIILGSITEVSPGAGTPPTPLPAPLPVVPQTAEILERRGNYAPTKSKTPSSLMKE